MLLLDVIVTFINSLFHELQVLLGSGEALCQGAGFVNDSLLRGMARAHEFLGKVIYG